MQNLIKLVFFIGAFSATIMILIDKWEIDRFITQRTGWWCQFCVTFWVNVFLTALAIIYWGWFLPYAFIPFASVHVGLFLFRLTNGEY
jgi:hypothetical protein